MPRNDCRPTLRHLKSAGISVKATEDFSVLAGRDDDIRRFIERRQDDADGGETGERVAQITSKPCFKLTSGRWRGATWFDQGHPPQDIVWLLGLEWHDERAKGRNDAYDILATLDDSGELFPKAIDYKRLELDRRRRDTENFASDARADAVQLAQNLLKATANVRHEVAGIPVTGVTRNEDGVQLAYFSVSEAPVTGQRSGLLFPLTSERFDLLRAAVVEAFEHETKDEVLSDTSPATPYPLTLPLGRQFFLIFGP